ncbi:hypothetical protein [Nocardioides litoris]|uniref:hypothetical protein n=1 Tax=Nocardioides litoris TaxID=1926648 RepID=UPI0014769A5A|nr:hypothetical protein [Nocardioides litoris]
MHPLVVIALAVGVVFVLLVGLLLLAGLRPQRHRRRSIFRSGSASSSTSMP